jgi:Delta7-sterol 5-desaturase
MKQILETIGLIFGLSMVRYVAIAGVAFVSCYLVFRKRMLRSKIQRRLATRRDFSREVIHSTLSTVVFAVIAYIVIYTPIRQYTRIYPHLSDHSQWWFWTSVVLGLVIHDTYFYWMHRLLHHKWLFRHVHALHHRSTNPSPWAAYSFHFAEAWIEGAVLLVIALLLPIHPIALLYFTVSAFVINVYGHLGYEIIPLFLRKTVIFEIVNTSVHHNLHHSKCKGNYGLYFRIWDRLMGTEHPKYIEEFDRVQIERSRQKATSRQKVEVKEVCSQTDLYPMSVRSSPADL